VGIGPLLQISFFAGFYPFLFLVSVIGAWEAFPGPVMPNHNCLN